CLLGAPFPSWVGCTPCETYPSSIQPYEEQRVEGLEPNSLNGKEIAGQKVLPIVAQELPPTAAFTARASLSQREILGFCGCWRCSIRSWWRRSSICRSFWYSERRLMANRLSNSDRS